MQLVEFGAPTSPVAQIANLLFRVFVVVSLPVAAIADSPTLETLFPAGAARGSTNAVTVTGKIDPWPPKVWISAVEPTNALSRSGPLAEASDIVVTAETNKGKLTIVVAPDAQPGPRVVRLFNEE